MTSKPRILITGISGYLGSNAAEYFAKAGFDVHGIAVSGSAGKIKKADITDATAVRTAIRAIKPDIVFHAAAIASLKACEENQKECHAVNAIGTKNLVDALLAIKPDATLIFISSDYVFDGKRDNHSEKDTPEPRTAYGKSKLLAEHEAARMKNHMIV
ncbi:MAG: sugar nucleotide-binding protein, partial [Candidatus Micrarchaeota archaeon]|nr:sugar nucleotide-binding protein [Candidatus Micrarchaeota archaeon]